MTAEIPLPPQTTPASQLAQRRRDGGSSDIPAASATSYEVAAESVHGGAATIAARATTIAFDSSARPGELLPGPAELLAAALAACSLKNVERRAACPDHAHVTLPGDPVYTPPRRRDRQAAFLLRCASWTTIERVSCCNANGSASKASSRD